MHKQTNCMILPHIHVHTHTHVHTHSGDQQSRDTSDNVNIELQKCGAYEVVQLSRQRVIMKNNPAYGEIGVGSSLH